MKTYIISMLVFGAILYLFLSIGNHSWQPFQWDSFAFPMVATLYVCIGIFGFIAALIKKSIK